MPLQINGLDPSGSGSGGGTLIGTYSTLDTLATVQAAGYFNEAASVLRWTNFLFVDASDERALLSVDVEDAVVSVSVIVQSGGGAVTVAWDDVTDKPATFAPTIGTTATTAKAGNYTPPNATTAARGLVLQGVAQANSVAADVPTLLTDFNALLAKLRTAGVLAP